MRHLLRKKNTIPPGTSRLQFFPSAASISASESLGSRGVNATRLKHCAQHCVSRLVQASIPFSELFDQEDYRFELGELFLCWLVAQSPDYIREPNRKVILPFRGKLTI